MNFYTVPIIINNRRERDFSLTEQPSDLSHNTFIVEVPGWHNFSLLTWQANTTFKSFVEHQRDFHLSELDFNVQLQNDTLFVDVIPKLVKDLEPSQKVEESTETYNYDDFDIKLPNKKNKVAEVVTQVDLPEFEHDLGQFNNHIALEILGGAHGIDIKGVVTRELSEVLFDKIKLTVVVRFHASGKIYHDTIQLQLAHPSQFLGIALDFGSESSQMASKRYAADFLLQEKKPQPENLYQNILSYHKGNQWFSPDETFDFYQEEKGTNFYKSLFFLKEILDGAYEDVANDPFIKNVQNNLKLLVNTSSYRKLYEQKYHQLPNLKILHQHGDAIKGLNFKVEQQGYDIPVSLSEIKQKVYNSILQIMIASFLKIEFIKYPSQKRLVRLLLLVPNNYNTQDILFLQRQLHLIFKNLVAEEYEGRLIAWEVQTISESDASFIGYMNKANVVIEKGKDYIVIDAGKGTTDFSVIRTGQRMLTQLTPIYRNGFAGAGNLVTYSVFETLLHHIRMVVGDGVNAKKYIRERILQPLLGNDLAVKNAFYQQLERLKQNYTKNTDQAIFQWQTARVGDIGFERLVQLDAGLDVLTELLSSIDHVGDFYGYIQETCSFIVENVVQYLVMIQENKKDLNVAGVLLTGRSFLFNPLKELMVETLQSKLQLHQQSIVLLKGNDLKEICIKGVFNNDITINSEKTGYPIQLVPLRDHATAPKPPKEKTKWRAQSIFAQLFNDINQLDQVEKILAFEDGVDLNRIDYSKILIGSRQYQVVGGSLGNMQPGVTYKSEIAFTSRNYVIRRLKNDVVDAIGFLREVEEEKDHEKNLVIPSLLPVYIEEQLLQSMQRDDIVPAIKNASTPNNNFNNSNNNPLYF